MHKLCTPTPTLPIISFLKEKRQFRTNLFVHENYYSQSRCGGKLIKNHPDVRRDDFELGGAGIGPALSSSLTF